MITDAPTSFQLPLTAKNVMRLSTRLRETYLTPEAGDGECTVQSSGFAVHVWLFSDRESIRLDIPREEFDCSRPYEQSVHRWGINLNRFVENGGIVVNTKGDRDTVPVEVTVL